MKFLKGLVFIILAAAIIFTLIVAVASAFAISFGLLAIFTIVWGIAKVTGTADSLERVILKTVDA